MAPPRFVIKNARQSLEESELVTPAGRLLPFHHDLDKRQGQDTHMEPLLVAIAGKEGGFSPSLPPKKKVPSAKSHQSRGG